eukprot:TRINITY_DN8986_c0_g1_i1.p2 TRINITY_DN8986_c0_g1~~TRINITY_DN8986_c0_g1_i1.p2  ORF type:complete len:266 (-),score=30.80 TRINITY_DN8986_c0_g1_i1:256-1053(-)
MTAGERRRSGRSFRSPSGRPRNKGRRPIEECAALARHDNAIECTYTPDMGLNEDSGGTSLTAVDGRDSFEQCKILRQASTIPDTYMRAKLTRAMLQQLKTSTNAKTGNGLSSRPQSAPAGGRQRRRSSDGSGGTHRAGASGSGGGGGGGGLHSAARAGRKSHGGLAQGCKPDASTQHNLTGPAARAPRPRSAPSGGRRGGVTACTDSSRYLPPWVKPADWEAIVDMGANKEALLQRPCKVAWVRPWYHHPSSAARGGSVFRLFDS